ncbi:MAG: hypothetical protein OIF40_06540 [Mangrovicoccus sp.]|nr:hypothetical protein [Mangrovicoccus sp.]
METAERLLAIGQGYLWIGLVVAAVFLAWGIDRVEAKAQGAWIFRPLLLPGAVLIWPLVLWRWLRVERGNACPQAPYRPPLTAQRLFSMIVIFACPAILMGALLLRQDGPLERPAVQLAAPQEGQAHE